MPAQKDGEQAKGVGYYNQLRYKKSNGERIGGGGMKNERMY
jgi:hypothetical protein